MLVCMQLDPLRFSGQQRAATAPCGSPDRSLARQLSEEPKSQHHD